MITPKLFTHVFASTIENIHRVVDGDNATAGALPYEPRVPGRVQEFDVRCHEQIDRMCEQFAAVLGTATPSDGLHDMLERSFNRCLLSITDTLAVSAMCSQADHLLQLQFERRSTLQRPINDAQSFRHRSLLYGVRDMLEQSAELLRTWVQLPDYMREGLASCQTSLREVSTGLTQRALSMTQSGTAEVAILSRDIQITFAMWHAGEMGHSPDTRS
ncbi:hypothetical protein [Cupriavidus pampae]|uniref:Chemotaxis protein n=1 Tax=Cupriavidus pampae TaxID=659251 RepID=A0ABM8XZX5_9BURK|nr:hypothetical protein [Cupriavidus pampae]CAG9185896.1 hypothetical protein LMG32289_06149 [Cupriavidus pampae]